MVQLECASTAARRYTMKTLTLKGDAFIMEVSGENIFYKEAMA